MREELVQLGNGAHALAIQLLGNPDDAADAVQDAYTRTLQNPGAYDPVRGPLRPWFLRVVRNRCLDLIRRRRPTSDTVDQLDAPGPGPEEALEAAERDRELHAALARLGEAQREILVLRDYLDLSYAEIAAVLDIATGTVMSRLHRARLSLKEELNGHGG
jgi:RNA polymerase sigma-70 factor (ECF subfamily)